MLNIGKTILNISSFVALAIGIEELAGSTVGRKDARDLGG
jgi:hypothetical protein